jgi:uncharacterized repeat protein (TIGR02543 family)
MYNDGQMIMLTATPQVGSSFVGWSDGCTGTSPTCIVTMDAKHTVIAEFEPAQFQLRVATNIAGAGSVVSTTDSGIDCGSDCDEMYNYGTFVSLKASAAQGYTFTGWSGACTGNGNCDLTMDTAYNVTANFAVTMHTLTVNRAGNGATSGMVVSVPGGVSCGTDCSESYNEGTVVTLTATASTGTNFTSWSGCTTVAGNVCSVTMNTVKNVTATFTLQTFALSVTRSGGGQGGVTSSPSGINCGNGGSACNVAFNYNTVVTLTATPQAGSTFAGWTGACTNATGTCMVTMTQARSVDARFNIIPPNYVFITSTQHNGNLGGLAGADAICNARADDAGLPGTYVAWLSTSTVHAKDRLGTARGWVRPDGKPVADTVADLTSGHLFFPIRLDETGTDVGTNTAMTATNSNGMYWNTPAYQSCSDWTSATTAAPGMVGGPAQANAGSFTNQYGFMCNHSQRLYCFGTDNQAVVAPPVVTRRIAFTSTTSWTPSGGLAAADAVCQGDATAAGLSGTFKAVLATSTASAISRFNTSGSPWGRRDYTLITPLASALASGSLGYLDASPNGNAANTLWFPASVQFWIGAPNLTSNGSSSQTCDNWNPSAGSTGRTGSSGWTKVSDWLGGSSSLACTSTTTRLLCFQE